MSLAIINLGEVHDGRAFRRDVDTLACEGGRVTHLGTQSGVALERYHTVIDAAGATAVPGLVDSHVHTTFGDYTPRQQTLGFLESYVHGGTTTVISASEVHVPGRPTDVIGVKALAIAAQRCFANYSPGGMKVHGGSVILEPGLAASDFEELARAGVRLAKAGFGSFPNAHDYVPIVAAARNAGIIVMCHVGGGSIAGTKSKIDAELLLRMRPDVLGHVNGGPTALSDRENRELVDAGEMALQLVQAGNLRSAIDIAQYALEQGESRRLLIATDTPTGTGVLPLGMLRSMAELCSLGPLSPELAIACATANVGAIYGLEAGRLEVGRSADVVILDAPLGSVAESAAQALSTGDVPAVSAVVIEGRLRLASSRNSPPPKRALTIQNGQGNAEREQL